MALPPGIKSQPGQMGVPTPYVAHVHPYPAPATGGKGGSWTRPVFDFPSVKSPQAVLKPDDFAPAAYERYPWAPQAASGLGQTSPVASALAIAAYVGSVAGTGMGAYHGYKRNDSVGWAIGWAALGGLFWPITIPVMLAQGLGKPKKHRANRSRRKVARRRRRGRK